jgi:hypothetical protein
VLGRNLRGSSGEAWALERRGRRGVGTGGRVDARAGSELLGGSAAEGKEEGKRWGSRAWGCHAARGCHGAWPRPAVVARQRPEHGARGRHAPRARAGRTERGERRVTGGPAREENGCPSQMNSKVSHLFDLV